MRPLSAVLRTPPVSSSETPWRLAQKRNSQCALDTEHSDPAWTTTQVDTRDSSSEGSSVLVDQEAINEAIRKCDKKARKKVEKRSVFTIAALSRPSPTLVSAVSLIRPAASLYPTGGSHYSSVRRLLAAQQLKPPPIDTADLMLSPRTTGPSRLSIVKCGSDPEPALIHARLRQKAINHPVPTKSLHPKRLTRKPQVAKPRPAEVPKAAALLANKCERAILKSKHGRLLKCFYGSGEWLLQS